MSGQQFSWEEQAHWLHTHLPQMRFTLNESHTSICTVWFDDDPDGKKVMRMGEILVLLFGAYLTGPFSDAALMGPTHQSVGFRTWELIANANRVLPLPAELQPGSPLYL